VLVGLAQGRLVAPALLYGLAVHFRIYPIIYAPSIVLFLAQRSLATAAATRGPHHQQQQQQQQQQEQQHKQHGTQPGSKQQLEQASAGRVTATPLQQQAGASPLQAAGAVLKQGLLFGGLSGGTFLGLGALFYSLYGRQFLQEAFLHHVGRKDPRHNFSVYFYHIYLTYMDWGQLPGTSSSSSSSGVGALLDPSRWAFVPQAALLLLLAVRLHRHLPLCWLLTTMAFVAFNKVSTAQYFLWYYCLLPLVVPDLPWPLPRRLWVALGAWVAAQLHWLGWGYALEFQGLPVHLLLWGAGVVFLVANVGLMTALLECCVPRSSFLDGSIRKLRQARLKGA
jgi:phosphatidylinositol glycan class M